MIGFWDFKLSGAPPLLSFGVRGCAREEKEALWAELRSGPASLAQYTRPLVRGPLPYDEESASGVSARLRVMDRTCVPPPPGTSRARPPDSLAIPGGGGRHRVCGPPKRGGRAALGGHCQGAYG
jgi:hypothetical protein